MLGGDPFNKDQQLGAGGDPSNEMLGGANWPFGDQQELGLAAPEMGGEDQPCIGGKKCDDGLYCRHWSEGTSKHGACRKLPKDHGGDGQSCYPAPHSPCKTGLKANENEDGKCVCAENLLGKHAVSADLLGKDAVSSDMLGRPFWDDWVVAPEMGGRGEACRNGDYPPYTECDAGLYCLKTVGGSATYGVCVSDSPSPSPSPSQSCGGQFERCCRRGDPCPGANVPRWNNQRGQAYQTCRCQPLLYTAGAAPGGN